MTDVQLARRTLKRARLSCDGYGKGLMEVITNGWNPEFHLNLLDQMREAMNNFIKCSLEILALPDDDLGVIDEKDIDYNYKEMEENRKIVNEFKAYRIRFIEDRNKKDFPIVKAEAHLGKGTFFNSFQEDFGDNKKLMITKPDYKDSKLEMSDIGLDTQDNKEEIKTHFFLCSICKQSFSVKSKYLKHKERCINKSSLKCETCDKEFISKKKLQIHTRSHQTSNCNLCGLSFPTNSLGFHRRQCSPNVKIYPCDLCPYETREMSHLRRHVSIHSRIKCKFCDESFVLKQDLKDHIYMHEMRKVETHSCSLCDKSYNLKSNLNRHLQIIHKLSTKMKKNKPPFLCDKCEYCSKRINDLKRHIERKHARDKSLKKRKCDYCDYSSLNSYNIRRHIEKDFCRQKLDNNRLKKKTEKVKPICEFCEKTFKKHSYIEIHKKLCIKGPYGTGMKKRKRPVKFQENQEKPLQCNMCKNFFKTESFLESHMENHLDFELQYEKMSKK